MRKMVTFSMLFSFIILIMTSIILYICPEGRVAYWANWTILGLSKTQWGDLHITGGVLFLITGLWHLLLNGKVILFHIKKSILKHSASPVPILIALVVNILFFAGTLYAIQPLKQILVWKDDIKKIQVEKYGNPPYGHAEQSTLETFCGFLRLDTDMVIKNLQQQLTGNIGRETTILEIAQNNKMTPQALYQLIQTSSSDGKTPSLPSTPPEGTGSMTLSSFCEKNMISCETVLKNIKEQGLSVQSKEQTFKEIATQNNIVPAKVYEIIRESLVPKSASK